MVMENNGPLKGKRVWKIPTGEVGLVPQWRADNKVTDRRPCAYL